jgi:hypothetical protein
MSWTTPADLRAQLQRLWERGELLRAAVNEGHIAWPLRLNLRGPTAAELSDRFDAVGAWARALANMSSLRIESRDWSHRVQGRQRLPAVAWADNLGDALACIGQQRATERYRGLWQKAAAAQPMLLPWLMKRPLQALELADRWDRLLAIVTWMHAHPRPGVYLRQVDLPGVDSKFIEAHRGLLAEWMDLVLPPEAIDPTATGTAQFARRYGFLDRPARIRFRPLDPALPTLPGCSGPADITLDAASFAELELPLARVFITENETNFLAFPPMQRSIVIFGAGYGWDGLAQATWLHGCVLHYWGDIDTHGFAILDQLRSRFAHARSFLMDRETLLAHRTAWGEESEPARHTLTRLDAVEAALYDELRFDRLQPLLRLEQERIGYRWLEQHLPGG